MKDLSLLSPPGRDMLTSIFRGEREGGREGGRREELRNESWLGVKVSPGKHIQGTNISPYSYKRYASYICSSVFPCAHAIELFFFATLPTYV